MTQYIFTNTGDTLWTVPAGVTSLSVGETVGGGQSSGFTVHDIDPDGGDLGVSHYGLGGNGAYYAKDTSIAVTPGETLSIRVGIGGTVSGLNQFNDYLNKTNGGDSWIKRSTTALVLAPGGGSASSPVGTTANVGGSGQGNGSAPGIGGGAGGAHGAGVNDKADANNAGRATYFDASHGFGDADLLYGGGASSDTSGHNGQQGIVVITATPGGGGGGGATGPAISAVVML